jgi:hypothetical protein
VDLQASVAKLVYREPLHIPRELLAASPTTGDPSELIAQLRHHFKHLRLVSAGYVKENCNRVLEEKYY